MSELRSQRRVSLIRALRLMGTLFSFFIVSCGGSGQAPVAPSPPGNPQLQPVVLPAYATLDVMESNKLARRLSIELNNSLNFTSIESAIASEGIVAGVDAAVASPRFHGAASVYVGRAFGVDAAALYDLDVMAGSDAMLSASLNNQMRFAIAGEPALSVERLLGNTASTFGDLFSGNATVMDPAAATLWGLTGSPAWSGRPELYTSYSDNRPRLGLVSSQSFLASSARLGGSVDHPDSRPGTNVIERLRCMSWNNPGAHDFSVVDGSLVSASGLAGLQSSSSACAACHSGIKSAGISLLGLGNRGGINQYKTYDESAGATWPSTWFGRSVSSWNSLSSAISGDEAVQSCVTQRVFEAIAQRPANYGRDIPRMSMVASTLASTGFKLTDWLLAILQSPATTSGPTLKTSKVSQLEGLVAKARWIDPRKMLDALAEAAPLAASDMNTIASELDPEEFPGHGATGRFVLPLGYAAQITGVAEAAVVAIVAREFAAGVGQSQRSVFSGVADAANFTSDEAEAESARIWKKWTGEQPSDERISSLRDLYDLSVGASVSGSAAGRTKDGMAAVLASILISPYFLSY